MTKVETDDGKYTFIADKGEINILRYRQRWWEQNGQFAQVMPINAIHSLIYKCEQQENKIKELEAALYSMCERD